MRSTSPQASGNDRFPAYPDLNDAGDLHTPLSASLSIESYPFDPATAFRNLRNEIGPEQVQEDTSANVSQSREPTTPVPESLVGGSEVLGIEIVHSQNRLRLPSVFEDSVLIGVEPHSEIPDSVQRSPQLLTPQSPVFDIDESREDYEPLSPLSRTSDSLRRLLSRRSSLGSRYSLRSNSLRSQPSTRSNRFSFRERRRIRDLEEGGGNSEQIDPAELDSIPKNIGPFELCALSREDRRNLILEMRPDLSRSDSRNIPSYLQIIEDLFGRQLCLPQYVGLRRVYMKQIDKKLTSALHDASVANPNGNIFPNPFTYLVSHIGLVSRQVTPNVTVTGFILSHMVEFAEMIRSGNVTKAGSQDHENRQKENEKEDEDEQASFTLWHQKIMLEWMRFALESWTMFDLSPFIENRHDLLSCQNFCDSPIEELIKPFLPPNSHQRVHSLPISATIPATIAPAELTASMLQDWKGIRFMWTNEISEHLLLDTQTKVVKLYSQIAYCHLHALANENSSLRKTGFQSYHSLLVEISDSYRLLFGSDRRSQAYFADLNALHPSPGYFNLFSLPSGDSEPRFLYNVVADFPVFGDRLLVLKTLLKPTGLSGLWRDRRDSLQWYTFWAVVWIGCFGTLLAMVQVGLGAIQAYASMAQLASSS